MQSLLTVWIPLAIVTTALDFGFMYFVEGKETMKMVARVAIDRFGLSGFIAGIIFADVLVPPLGLAAIAARTAMKRKK
jgi:hypothetical protein